LICGGGEVWSCFGSKILRFGEFWRKLSRFGGWGYGGFRERSEVERGLC